MEPRGALSDDVDVSRREGALLLSSEFVIMLWSAIGRQSEQGSFRQILAGKFVSFLAFAHDDDAIADLGQFVGVPRDDKEGAAALAQVEPDFMNFGSRPNVHAARRIEQD